MSTDEESRCEGMTDIRRYTFWDIRCYVGHSDEDGGYLGELYSEEGVYIDTTAMCKTRAEAVSIARGYAEESAELVGLKPVSKQ